MKTNGHFLHALEHDLKQRRPARASRRRRHCDSGGPIDLRYNRNFYAPAPNPSSNAASSSMSNSYSAPFAGEPAYRVESFTEEEDEETIWGTGELEEEEEAEATYTSEASRSFSEEEETVWGTGELEEIQSNPTTETQSRYSRAASETEEFSEVWGTGELEDLDAETPPAPATPQSLPRPSASSVQAQSSPAFHPPPSDDADTRAFQQDIQAILAGKKEHPSTTPTQPATEPAPDAEDDQGQPSNLQPHASAFAHDVFDSMGKSMSTATTFDLGSFSLQKTFDAFDARLERAAQRKSAPAPVPAAQQSTAEDFAEDLSLIRDNKVAPAVPTPPPATIISRAQDDPRLNNPDWPPRPATVRHYSQVEKEAQFGHFEYAPDPSTHNGDGVRILGDWVAQNIISVPIPQLNGKRFGMGGTITDGSIRFHRSGRQALIDLWREWESAGLLDRIETYNGGFTARFIRRTETRSPRPLSPHAWGCAFDINAATNRLGAVPALLGQEGCVRELVEIANRHGFFWGGHFNRKDGMHFELGRVLTP